MVCGWIPPGGVSIEIGGVNEEGNIGETGVGATVGSCCREDGGITVASTDVNPLRGS